MVVVLVIGVLAGVSMIVALAWSIVRPDKRLWPPVQPTLLLKVVVWVLTVAIFASAAFLGVFDWNALNLPPKVRWGVGFPLIVVGNGVVWSGVYQLGMRVTSGEADKLHTTGLYEYSRNPQYVADIAILVGWGVLCASAWAMPVVLLGVIALLIAPFSEEPWLENSYGATFRKYQLSVRRFL